MLYLPYIGESAYAAQVLLSTISCTPRFPTSFRHLALQSAQVPGVQDVAVAVVVAFVVEGPTVGTSTPLPPLPPGMPGMRMRPRQFVRMCPGGPAAFSSFLSAASRNGFRPPSEQIHMPHICTYYGAFRFQLSTSRLNPTLTRAPHTRSDNPHPRIQSRGM